ncbi:uroporphyrinogen decarboxylase family protein [uncultured Megasphaera sp.]|uniref:uroporphyrinogen decarboxylase family protein n=1 Tax=uncultured Megasphaera sp. TaxID=165188 RepID=UPI002657BFDD|nr:uroporphyrinogen decarboxylase family protein [uncultured Megasphaera sp.]
MPIHSCGADPLETLHHPQIFQYLSWQPQQIYECSAAMADAARVISRQTGDALCHLPLDNTAEAEAWGAVVSPGTTSYSPRIACAPYASVETLLIQPAPPVEAERIGSILQALSLLQSEGKPTALHISGPFTILSQLIDPVCLYKTWRREPEQIWQALHRISTWLLTYASQGIQHGACMLSYADTVLSPTLLGPKRWEQVIRNAELPLLTALSRQVPQPLIHLCPQLYSSLAERGWCTPAQPIGRPDETYSQALRRLAQTKEANPHLVGGACVHSPTLSSTNLYALHLSEPYTPAQCEQ